MQAVLKKFRSLKGLNKVSGAMPAKDLKTMIKNLEETSFFEVNSIKGRKSIASMSVEDMARTLQKEMSSDVQIFIARGIARSLNIL